jgi:transcriptional regulator with XRE-family HTH domain
MLMFVQRRSSASPFQRLLLQRRLKRTDFTPLSAKTIARIERNEIAKPHGATLNTIARRLRVSPDEIGEY